uniref:(northern house mosquito) hypothetical protein n=1 Tax=Culex pipiens TaxID=7175 RepID=A0A8D8C1Z6_CULPI
MLGHGRRTKGAHLDEKVPQGSHQQGQLGALCGGLTALRYGFARRQAHHLGHLDREQGAGHPAAVGLGHECGLCRVRELCCLRGHGQYVHRVRHQQSGRPGQRQDCARVGRLRGFSELVPVPGRYARADRVRRFEDLHLGSAGGQEDVRVRCPQRGRRFDLAQSGQEYVRDGFGRSDL